MNYARPGAPRVGASASSESGVTAFPTEAGFAAVGTTTGGGAASAASSSVVEADFPNTEDAEVAEAAGSRGAIGIA